MTMFGYGLDWWIYRIWTQNVQEVNTNEHSRCHRCWDLFFSFLFFFLFTPGGRSIQARWTNKNQILILLPPFFITNGHSQFKNHLKGVTFFVFKSCFSWIMVIYETKYVALPTKHSGFLSCKRGGFICTHTCDLK